MTPFEESLRRALDAPPPAGPGWLRDARARAADRFRAAGVPHARLEDWRFTSLQPMAATGFAAAPAGSAAPPSALPEGEPRLVLVDGRIREERSDLGALPGGVVAMGLARAVAERPDLVQGRLGALAEVEGRPFAALNAALFEDGILLHVPAGAVVERTVHVVHVTSAAGGPTMSHPRVLVVAGERARITVAEHWVGGGGAPALANGVTELVLGPGAEVEHYGLQDLGPGAFQFGALFAEQAAGARLRLHGVALGGRISRTEIHVRLAGAGASLELGGLAMLGGEQLSDVHSVVEHAVPGCQTVESYKAILDGRSRGVFAGRIRVLPGAQKTQAHQQSSSLLLSEDALIDTMPQLEIFADDVKCGHGGAVGQLDAAALFYLRSRGLDAAAARALLIYAFAAEMVERIAPEPLRRHARALVAARLPGGALLPEAA